MHLVSSDNQSLVKERNSLFSRRKEWEMKRGRYPVKSKKRQEKASREEGASGFLKGHQRLICLRNNLQNAMHISEHNCV